MWVYKCLITATIRSLLEKGVLFFITIILTNILVKINCVYPWFWYTYTNATEVFWYCLSSWQTFVRYFGFFYFKIAQFLINIFFFFLIFIYFVCGGSSTANIYASIYTDMSNRSEDYLQKLNFNFNLVGSGIKIKL